VFSWGEKNHEISRD